MLIPVNNAIVGIMLKMELNGLTITLDACERTLKERL